MKSKTTPAAARRATAPQAIRTPRTHGGLETATAPARRGTRPQNMTPHPVPGTPSVTIRPSKPLTAAQRGTTPEFPPISLPEHPI